MSERMFNFLLQLSRRERGLLVLLIAVVLPLALVFGLLLPLAEARQKAEAEARHAGQLQAWVLAQARQIPPETTARAAQSAIGPAAIEDSLVAAGLRDAVTRLANRGKDGLEVQFEAVDFAALTAWLDRMRPTWGYRLHSFALDRSDTPGLIGAEFVLVPAR